MSAAREWDAYVNRARAEHGDKLDLSEIATAFLPYFRGARIRVTTRYGDETVTRTGTVGVTSGWRPALLLMHRSSDHGSSDLLSDRDEITHVQYGRTYVPVANLYARPTS